MKYLYITVEGSTEENFVKEVLAPHLYKVDIVTEARRVTTGWNKINKKSTKGGLMKYKMLEDDIVKWIRSQKNRSDVFFSCFVDLYAFPIDDYSPFTADIRNISNPYAKVTALEDAIRQKINYTNFIPYVQLHEFETFILVEPDKLLVAYPQCERDIAKLKKDIVNLTPELVNNSPSGAPSKRIIKYISEYEDQKALIGPLVAAEIGLEKLRSVCSHFNEWVSKIESL